MENKQRKPDRKNLNHASIRTRKESWLRVVGIAAHVVVGAALLSIAAQLLYPSERVLPSTKIDGKPVGMVTEKKLLKQLDELAANAELTIKTPAKTRHVLWASIGITIDRLATAEMVVNYEWWERLIPFSSLVRMSLPSYTPLVIVDYDRLDVLTEKIAKKDQREVKEASISVENGKVRVDPAKAGYIFEKETIKRQLLATPFADGAQVALEPRTILADHQPLEVHLAADRMRQLLKQDVTLYFNGQIVTPQPKTIGSWLEVKEDKQTKKLRLAIDRLEVKKYLEKQNQKYADPPEPIYVTLLDGREIKRTSSAPGLAMDVGQAVKTIEGLLLDSVQDAVATLPLVAVQPDVIYHRTYSQTSAGLNALIRYWEATTYGNYGIIVQEIGSKNRHAEFGADKRFVTASTYKMFLAYTVFTKIEAGKIKPDQKTDIGWTVEDCMTEMIVNSTNPCAISLQNLVGWKEVDRMLHAAGFTETYLNNKNGNSDKHTTVRDETDFLLRLYGGSLMNKKHTNQLLGLMKRQIWRGGIPSGVPYGTVVANKVGFYDGWVHDVAIVYGPKSTYILAIMSRGGSDPVFAELSRQVYSFFNR